MGERSTSGLPGTHSHDGSRVDRVFNGACVFVCLSACFPKDISKANAASC